METGIFLTETTDYFYGRHTDLVHKFNTSVSHMLNDLLTDCDILTGLQLFWVNRDGCHMWDRKCSLFLEHSLWGVHDFTHSLYIYIVYYWICQFKDYVY